MDLTAVVARCRECNGVFVAPAPRLQVALHGVPLPVAMAGGTVSPCPRCGGMGDVVGGESPAGSDAFDAAAFDDAAFAQRTIIIVRELARAGVDLETVAADLQRAQESGEDVAAAAARHSPALAKFLRTALERADPEALYKILSVLLTAIGIYVAHKDAAKPSVVINNVQQQIVIQAPLEAKPSRPPASTDRPKQLKGHHPCLCGSGKKLRNCDCAEHQELRQRFRVRSYSSPK